jgi:thioredoxin-like negative regulator of GroEL
VDLGSASSPAFASGASTPNPAAIMYPQPTRPGGKPIATSEEIFALDRAMGLLRGKHDAQAALSVLDDYLHRFPEGKLVQEARVARMDALLMLNRSDEALLALETLPLDEHGRSAELQLIRGELRARNDCPHAEQDFAAVLARTRSVALEERALYGRASCRTQHGDAKGAVQDLRRYLERFPNGSHAAWARQWLESSYH